MLSFLRFSSFSRFSPAAILSFALALVLVPLLAAPAHASVDFSTLTDAVDLGGVAAAILAVAALMISPIAVKWGAKIIQRLFG